MKKLLLLITLLVTISAHAFDYEVSAGKTFYTQSNNTIYWQDGKEEAGFSNNYKLSPMFFSLGIRDGNNRYGYAKLGKATMSSVTTQYDAEYNTETHVCNPGCKMIAWQGESQTDGFYATHLFKHDSGFFAEGGVYAYRTTLFALITDKNPGGLGVWSLPAHKTYGLGPVLGVGYERGNYTVAATAYYVRRYGEFPAVYKPWAAVLSVRYKF